MPVIPAACQRGAPITLTPSLVPAVAVPVGCAVGSVGTWRVPSGCRCAVGTALVTVAVGVGCAVGIGVGATVGAAVAVGIVVGVVVAVALGSDGAVGFEQGDFGKGFVHILDDRSLQIVMEELDTITDFVEYLLAKEALISSGATPLVTGLSLIHI